MREAAVGDGADSGRGGTESGLVYEMPRCGSDGPYQKVKRLEALSDPPLGCIGAPMPSPPAHLVLHAAFLVGGDRPTDNDKSIRQGKPTLSRRVSGPLRMIWPALAKQATLSLSQESSRCERLCDMCGKLPRTCTFAHGLVPVARRRNSHLTTMRFLEAFRSCHRSAAMGAPHPHSNVDRFRHNIGSKARRWAT